MKKIEISFFLRADKTNNSGIAPIHCRIRINDSHCTFSTKYYVNAIRWQKTWQLKNSRVEAEMVIRQHIISLHERLTTAATQAFKRGVFLNAIQLKNEVLGPPKEEKEYCLLEAFVDHKNNFSEQVKLGERSLTTLSKYDTTKKHIEAFLKQEYNLNDIPLSKLNFEFIDKFHRFMRKDRNCSHNYVVRRCEFLKSVVRRAYLYDKISHEPFKRYTSKKLPVNPVFLTKDEVVKIQQADLKNPALDVVRDLFLFTVFTGLAGSDVAQLTSKHIVRQNDGSHWIIKKRQKTGVESSIPLLPPAKAILDKYCTDVTCIEKGVLLPKRSNQKINKHLKELAEMTGIQKHLHYYVARHTFATTICMSNHVSMESTSRMLGHKNLKQTQHYARILNDRIGEEMSRLHTKF